jgi:hypothetical protein
MKAPSGERRFQTIVHRETSQFASLRGENDYKGMRGSKHLYLDHATVKHFKQMETTGKAGRQSDRPPGKR